MRNICIVREGTGRTDRSESRSVRCEASRGVDAGGTSDLVPGAAIGRTPFTRRRPPSDYGRSVPESIAPIFRLADGRPGADGYARLGFTVTGEHRFAPELPLHPGSAEATA